MGLPVAADLPDRPLELVVAPEEVARQFAGHGETGRQRDDQGLTGRLAVECTE